ncbi:MAG: MFS transporter [Oscillospiraceae bacterium]|nr:MFS transporter [Oscillospiraceae bacterium]
MQKKARFWLSLTLFSLIGQIAWVVENMYLNVFIYKMFRASAGELSLMVGASAVAATVTTVLIGALSDRVGKRKLFICGGYILWGVSIFCFALLRADVIGAVFPMAASAAAVGVSLTITLDCVMTFFGSSANDAAFNAWLTDSADSKNRGAAEGINAMMPLIAILAVFGSFMGFDLDRAESWTSIFLIIGGAVLIVGIVGLFILEDVPAAPSKDGYWENVLYGFRPATVRENGRLYLFLGAFILFNISIQIFMPYLIIYYEVSLGMADYVFVMAPAILIAAVVTAFWGRFYDKKGFGLSGWIALLWLCGGYVILYLCRGTGMVFVGSLLMMCGYLAGMAVFGAKIRDLIPTGKAGRLQGVRIFSQVLVPGVIGPFIGKSVLKNAELLLNDDGTTSFVPNENIFLAALAAAAVLAVFLLMIPKEKPRTVSLTTPFEPSDWNEYPRPQMKRDSFMMLNGEWALSVLKNGAETPVGTIKVPFPPESALSGIGRTLKKGEKWVYRRRFTLPEGFKKEKLLLHFGAVDQIADVRVNGEEAGRHEGGYLPFDVDVSGFVREGENEIEVLVTDELDRELAWGKQRKDQGGMWYTPVSGIWQPVWLESLPEKAVGKLKLTPALDSITIETEGGGEEKTVVIRTPMGELTRSWSGDSVTIRIEDPRNWTPEDPYLYEFTLICGADRIESYFALRTVTVEKVKGQAYICLNGKPRFFHGLLDQGYYSDGIYLPASAKGYEYDILTMKKMGFDMLRKHIKIEPEVFYYLCDKHGMIVFQDMVNSGKYSFLIDTALPTAGLKKGISHRASAKRRTVFERDCRETAELLYNHPCVCYYTIFNEGWGQYDADRIYEEMKAADPTRVWDATSGWFTEKKSDVTSEHIYFKKIRMQADPERPMVLSEFGGYSCKIAGHAFNLDKTYGYRFFEEREKFAEALVKLYREEVIPAVEGGLSAAVLTQVSDVEDETNGLVTYDRAMVKADEDAMAAVAAELREAFRKRTE